MTPSPLLTPRPPPRAVGTFARALDCSSSIRQPSLHMSAAAASRDITLVRLGGLEGAPVSNWSQLVSSRTGAGAGISFLGAVKGQAGGGLRVVVDLVSSLWLDSMGSNVASTQIMGRFCGWGGV